ncbi:MAG TPA: guanylate kinase [Candidatus Hydrogenedentes bacterium]|nr:guanylate kinase [Candidatus Hydrogenedentota bacterium]
MQQSTHNGRLVVVAAPSGAGKGTLLKRVREQLPNITVTVSATTRPPRPGETDGVEYFFYSPEEFDRLIAENALVEWAHVHGERYGTLKSELDRVLRGDNIVIFELDVQGMRHIKRLYPDAVSVFIAPPSMEELERRLAGRGTNNAEDMALRLKNARGEMSARLEFDYVVVNDDLARATAELIAVVRGEARSTKIP